MPSLSDGSPKTLKMHPCPAAYCVYQNRASILTHTSNGVNADLVGGVNFDEPSPRRLI